MARTKRAEHMKEVRREEILRAARTLFGRSGFDRVTISEICDEAGIAKGTFYIYFKDKLSLLETILDEVLDLIYDSIAQFDPEEIQGAEDALQHLSKLWLRLGSTLSENKELTRLFFQESYHMVESLDSRINSIFPTIAEHVAKILRRGVELDLIYPSRTEISAYLIIGAVERVFYQYASGHIDEPIETIMSEIAEFLFRSLLKKEL